MEEYISREAFYKILESWRDAHADVDDADGCGLLEDVMTELNAQPAANVAPVVHGRWVLGKVEPGYFTPGGNRPWICSVCGYLASWMLDSPTYHHCPNCGARMDGE